MANRNVPTLLRRLAMTGVWRAPGATLRRRAVVAPAAVAAHAALAPGVDVLAAERLDQVLAHLCEEAGLDRAAPPALPEAADTGPELALVRNPWHLKALAAGCAARGVCLLPGESVAGFDREGNRVTGVRTSSGRFAAGSTVIAAGGAGRVASGVQKFIDFRVLWVSLRKFERLKGPCANR